MATPSKLRRGSGASALEELPVNLPPASPTRRSPLKSGTTSERQVRELCAGLRRLGAEDARQQPMCAALVLRRRAPASRIAAQAHPTDLLLGATTGAALVPEGRACPQPQRR